MGAINSYSQYRTYFGFPINGGTPSTGIVYAIYTIGNLAGSFACGPATDFRGTIYFITIRPQGMLTMTEQAAVMACLSEL